MNFSLLNLIFFFLVTRIFSEKVYAPFFLIYYMSFFLLSYLLYEPSPSSSYVVIIRYFWSYRAPFSWFFIMNEDLWGFSYCLGLSFCIKCDSAKQMTFINAEVVVESSGNFRKLPRKSLSSLGCTLVAWTRLKHDLGVWLRRVLGLTNDTRFCVHYQNGLVNAGFIFIVWANT